MNPNEDLELLEGTRQGDAGAFERLVRKYEKPVHNLIFRFTGGAGDIDDLAQEVFLRVYRSAHRFEAQSKFFTWLYRITLNVCLKERDRRRVILGLAALLVLCAPAARAQGNPNPRAEENRQRIQAVHERFEVQRSQLELRIQQARVDLATMLENDAPPAQTQARLQQVIGLEGQRESLKLQEYYEVYNLLGPKQRQTYKWRVIRQLNHQRPSPQGNP
ncbi:MAG: sigma-70 family RNA polymerase sigma factor [Candidatus Xenobia bacterium]